MRLDEKIDAYERLLKKWQNTINLVGPSTLSEAKKRHFEDSLQLLKHIPVAAKTLYDLGSGAGFPGLVLAMAKPDLDVHLIESDARKCQFLKTVSRETETPVTVHNQRIESANLPLPTSSQVALWRIFQPFSSSLKNGGRTTPKSFLFFPKAKTSSRSWARHKKYTGLNTRLSPVKQIGPPPSFWFKTSRFSRGCWHLPCG